MAIRSGRSAEGTRYGRWRTRGPTELLRRGLRGKVGHVLGCRCLLAAECGEQAGEGQCADDAGQAARDDRRRRAEGVRYRAHLHVPQPRPGNDDDRAVLPPYPADPARGDRAEQCPRAGAAYGTRARAPRRRRRWRRAREHGLGHAEHRGVDVDEVGPLEDLAPAQVAEALRDRAQAQGMVTARRAGGAAGRPPPPPRWPRPSLPRRSSRRT